MNAKGQGPIEVLLIEDSPTDVLLAKAAFENSEVGIHLQTVSEGVEAMAYLLREAKYEDAIRPDLILLDLNLPKKDGREVLAEIKADESLKRIPVVVLTTSRSETDILKAYGLHANCYIVKPVDFVKFSEVVKCIEAFWFSVASLPGNS